MKEEKKEEIRLIRKQRIGPIRMEVEKNTRNRWYTGGGRKDERKRRRGVREGRREGGKEKDDSCMYFSISI